jgi:hypothetical protein
MKPNHVKIAATVSVMAEVFAEEITIVAVTAVPVNIPRAMRL